MPMQIGLDELLTMLVSRVEEMSLDTENQKSRFNIMFRMLYKKGLFEAAKTVEAEGKKAGWSDERVELVKAKIMGLKVTYDEKPAED